MPNARSLALFVPVLLCLAGLPAVAQPGGSGEPAFSPQTWQRAPRSDDKPWSRQAMTGPLSNGILRKGMRRADVIALLGPPGHEFEFFLLGQGMRERRDSYRLSSRNADAYALRYDEREELTDMLISPCPAYSPSTDAVIPASVLPEKLLRIEPAARGYRTMTMAQFQELVGHPAGFQLDHGFVGGRNWLNFSRVWRFAGPRPRYLLVYGYIAHPRQPPEPETMKSFEQHEIGEFRIITSWPNCLAP